MDFGHTKLWAWLFLYSLTAGFLGVFGYGVFELVQAIELERTKITWITNFYLLLLPALLPILHLSYIVQHWSRPRSQGLSRPTLFVGLLLFILMLVSGYWLESFFLRKLIQSGYVECVEERQQGLRSEQQIYKRDLSQCI